MIATSRRCMLLDVK